MRNERKKATERSTCTERMFPEFVVMAAVLRTEINAKVLSYRCRCYNIYSIHTLRTKYSCIRRSGLSSGWKLVAIFLPFLTATTRSASSSAGPSGPSDGGASAAKSGGSEHNG